MRLLWLVCFFLVSKPVISAGLNHDFRPVTHLNKLNFFDYTITRFELEDSFVELEFDKAQNKFKDKMIPLTIETNIPEAETGFGYRLTLDSNISTCQRDGTVIQENFISVLIDEQPFVNGHINFDSFPLVTGDGYLKNDNMVKLTSQEIIAQGLRCGGSVVLLAELNI